MKATKILPLFAIAAIASQSACEAATSGYANDCGAWLPVAAKIPIYKRIQAYVEYQPRWQRNHINHFSESIIRTGLGYEFNNHWSAFSGYYWSARMDKELNHENRLWQQVSYTTKHGRWQVQNRVRLEETWRKKYEGASVRVRNQVRVAYTVGRSPWYLVTSEEPFFNLNSPEKGPESGLAQNRLFVGVGRKLNRYMRMEIGYMNQYQFNRTKVPDQMNHVLFSQVAFDFTAKKAKPETKLARLPVSAVVALAPLLVYTGLSNKTTLMFDTPSTDVHDDVPVHASLRHLAQHKQHTI